MTVVRRLFGAADWRGLGGVHAVCGTMLTVLKKLGPSSFGVHAIYMRRRLLAESLAKACLGHCIRQAHAIDALVQHSTSAMDGGAVWVCIKF